MYAETFTFFGIITLILFVFAEAANHKIIGVLASLLVIMLGLWVGGSGFYFPTGTSTTIINATSENATYFPICIGGTSPPYGCSGSGEILCTGAVITCTHEDNPLCEVGTPACQAGTATSVETLTLTHAPINIPSTPIDFSTLLTLVLVLIGVYGMLYYSLNLFGYGNKR